MQCFHDVIIKIRKGSFHKFLHCVLYKQFYQSSMARKMTKIVRNSLFLLRDSGAIVPLNNESLKFSVNFLAIRHVRLRYSLVNPNVPKERLAQAGLDL